MPAVKLEAADDFTKFVFWVGEGREGDYSCIKLGVNFLMSVAAQFFVPNKPKQKKQRARFLSISVRKKGQPAFQGYVLRIVESSSFGNPSRLLAC